MNLFLFWIYSEVLRGCLDTNGDNYVGYVHVNQGCKYSYKITGNINGLGGQQLFSSMVDFIGRANVVVVD